MISTKDGNRIIIAISGKQLSGKDTFAKLLLELLPDFKRIGLGDAIKQEFAKKNNLSVETVEQNKHLYRPELIALGNKGRTLDSGLYWIKKVMETEGNIIIPDMRVVSEFNAFKDSGAILIRVESDKDVRASRGTLVREDDPTECALDNIETWDAVIYNNSSYEHLKLQTENFCLLLPILLMPKK
ncbi:MAG: hypothetical protein AB1782_18405 [Cyanobacteriota bacterium]